MYTSRAPLKNHNDNSPNVQRNNMKSKTMQHAKRVRKNEWQLKTDNDLFSFWWWCNCSFSRRIICFLCLVKWRDNYSATAEKETQQFRFKINRSTMWSVLNGHSQSVRLIYRLLITRVEKKKRVCFLLFISVGKRIRCSHGSLSVCLMRLHWAHHMCQMCVPDHIIHHTQKSISFRQWSFYVRIESVTMLNKLFIILSRRNSYLTSQNCFPFSKLSVCALCAVVVVGWIIFVSFSIELGFNERNENNPFKRAKSKKKKRKRVRQRKKIEEKKLN